VDPDDLVNESNENNNTATIETTVQTVADLVSHWVAGPTIAQSDASVILHGRVRNIGDRDAADVTVVFDVPVSIDIDNFDGGNFQCSGPGSRLGQQNFAAALACFTGRIPAGGESTITLTVHHKHMGRGEAQLMITADPRNTVLERDKSNNTAPLTLTLVPAADLQISGAFEVLTPNWQNFEDQTVVVLKVKVQNAGPGPSPSTTLTVDWARPFSDLQSVCNGVGGFFDLHPGGCIFAASPPSQPCFRTAALPGLEPGQSIEISCYATMRSSRELEFGRATLDPDHVVPDPNRSNNSLVITE
jgi:hypothetical protein